MLHLIGFVVVNKTRERILVDGEVLTPNEWTWRHYYVEVGPIYISETYPQKPWCLKIWFDENADIKHMEIEGRRVLEVYHARNIDYVEIEALPLGSRLFVPGEKDERIYTSRGTEMVPIFGPVFHIIEPVFHKRHKKKNAKGSRL